MLTLGGICRLRCGEGTAAGKYASQLLKAGCAAQPGELLRPLCPCWCLGPGMILMKREWSTLWLVVHKNGVFVYYNPPKMRCKEGILGWVVHESPFFVYYALFLMWFCEVSIR